MFLTRMVTRAGRFPVCIALLGLVLAGGRLLAKEHTQMPEVVAVQTGASPAGEADRDAFQVLPGFKIERLLKVPREEMGSWVALARDGKGRLIASDERNKGLYRITPAPLDGSGPTKVERLDVDISAAQGILHAFDSLYVVAHGRGDTGLYRLRDTDGDDQYDEVKKLKTLRGNGEHGPHAVRLSPDGKSLYVVCGNHTKPPFKPGDERRNRDLSSAVPSNWDEDFLLPRQWDAGRHAVGIMAPGGWIAETDPDGKTWRVVSTGYRNSYDIAFNADGELFAYDSDMEWEMGMPWYRPTRLMHVPAGSEFGWRSGSGKWPDYYVDSLPGTVNMGPGSPTGITFGYGTKFPEKYQKALFLCDWTFGTIYAVHLEPEGATYKGVKEEFLSRSPLALTSALVGSDGAIYFVTGGRGIPSELFRITYVGDEKTDPVDAHDQRFAAEHDLRRKIESYQRTVDDPAAAVEFLWPHLGHKDRFIRYAARVALEHQPVKEWQQRVIAPSDQLAQQPDALIGAAVALARQGDQTLQGELLKVLDKLSWDKLTKSQRLDLLRAYELVFIRMGMPEESTKARLAEKFDQLYPASDDFENRELCNLLVYLESPNVVRKTIPLLAERSKSTSANNGDASDLDQLIVRGTDKYQRPIAAMLKHRPDGQRLHYFLALRNVKAPWSPEDRKKYYDFLREAETWRGGASFQGHLVNIEREAFENAPEIERLAIEGSGWRKATIPESLPTPKGPGRDRTVDDVLRLAEKGLQGGRNFASGKTAFAAARCVVCHYYGGEGGATGPDLTQLAGRFTLKDLTEAIVEPSKVISDRYRESIYLVNGVPKKGRLVGETSETITLLVDAEDPTKTEEIQKSDVEEPPTHSPLSIMPSDLLKPLGDEEVLDLLAYLLSRGNAKDPMFRPLPSDNRKNR